MKHARWLVPVLVALLVGCASTAPGDSEQRTRRQANLITTEEIREAQRSTALEVVQGLRPQWLQRRGQDSILSGGSAIMVYVDGSRFGTVAALQQISATSVSTIRFLSATEATSRFGLDHGSGAILVTTRLE